MTQELLNLIQDNLRLTNPLTARPNKQPPIQKPKSGKTLGEDARLGKHSGRLYPLCYEHSENQGIYVFIERKTKLNTFGNKTQNGEFRARFLNQTEPCVMEYSKRKKDKGVPYDEKKDLLKKQLRHQK